MAEFSDLDVQYIADQIEKYLKVTPNAADTVEGITQWWLRGQGIEASSLIVKKALDYLGAKSIVRCNANLSGNKVYSSYKAKSREMTGVQWNGTIENNR